MQHNLATSIADDQLSQFANPCGESKNVLFKPISIAYLFISSKNAHMSSCSQNYEFFDKNIFLLGFNILGSLFCC